MPVPTPPKKDLLKVVTPPKPAVKPKAKVPRGPSKATQKVVKEIRDLTEALTDDKNTVAVPTDGERITQAIDKLISPMAQAIRKEVAKSRKPQVKSTFKPAEHLTVSLSENDTLKQLQKQLTNNTTGEN